VYRPSKAGCLEDVSSFSYGCFEDVQGSGPLGHIPEDRMRIVTWLRIGQTCPLTLLLLHRAFRWFNHFFTPTYALIYILSVTKIFCSFDCSYMFRHTAFHHQGAPLFWLNSLVKKCDCAVRSHIPSSTITRRTHRAQTNGKQDMLPHQYIFINIKILQIFNFLYF
jgi:hypothetical protein